MQNPTWPQQTQTQNQKKNVSSDIIKDCKNKPFWIWDKIEHEKTWDKERGKCCFNHIVGLPRLHGEPKQLFDYEELVVKTIEQKNGSDAVPRDGNVWIKKSRGLGITELILRYLAWLSLSTDKYKDKMVCIVTGPRINLAMDLILRLKHLFREKYPRVFFESTATSIIINNVKMMAFPSHTVETMRGYKDVFFILVDEADYFPKGQQIEMRAAVEGYRGKTNPFIVLVSTPKAPGGVFERIEREENCYYHRLPFDYRDGLDKIYDRDFIEKEKGQLYFPREYEGKYQGAIGNVYSMAAIQRAIDLGKSYDPNIVNKYSRKVIAVDPGFGSSAFGLLVAEFANGRIQILHADETERPDYNEKIRQIWYLMQRFGNVKNIFVDAANPEFIDSLRKQVGDIHTRKWIEERIAYCKKYNLDINDSMIVVPKSFNEENGRIMLEHSQQILELKQNVIAINPKFDKLITGLRSALADSMGKLDKENTSYDNIVDCFRMAMTSFHFKDYKG